MNSCASPGNKAIFVMGTRLVDTVIIMGMKLVDAVIPSLTAAAAAGLLVKEWTLTH